MSTAQATRRIRPKLRPHRWALMFCCNEHTSGAFTGQVDSINFGAGRGNFSFGTDWSDDFSLEIHGPAVDFQWVGRYRFRLGEKEHRCDGQQHFVGNWCWDGCFVERRVLREICPWLKSMGWAPESGATQLWQWWEGLGK